MRYLNKQFSYLIVLFCLPLIFLPKINLLSFGGRETAGIRLDDIVLLGLFGIVFWAHFSLEKRLKDVEGWMFLLVGFSLFSFVINKLLVSTEILHVNASLFYCVRILEYFLFFYIGAFSSLFIKCSTVIRAFFLWNLVLIVLQKAGLFGQFSNYGYLSSATDRAPGIAAFPSETGALLNIAFCFLIYDQESGKKWISFLPSLLRKILEKTYIYWLFLICSLLVIMTGSRIAIVATVFAFAFKIKEDINWRSFNSMIVAILFIGMASVAMTHFILNTDSIFQRSAGLLSFKNIELFGIVWDMINIDYDPMGNEVVQNNNLYDMSWWMRIHKWCYALKIYYLHPECYLQGIGPGFAMAGLDGGFLRILTEYGIIGCFLFWKVFAPIYQKNKMLKWMVISLMINMIFFDVYLAYKPMSLLFFITGYAYSQLNQTLTSTPDFSPNLKTRATVS